MITTILSLGVSINAKRQDSGITPNQESETCLVPCDEIVNGGPPKDGIPSIDDPKFYTVEEAKEDLDPGDRIVGVEIEGVMYGFPHNILNWHEIVNVHINNAVKAITYCPLTGTAIPFNFRGEIGTSGNLYENNLVFYDRDTDSYWAQMYGQSIKGERLGEKAAFGDSIETTWKAFSVMFPDAQILTRDTGYGRNYDNYPYAQYSYLTSNFILFQSSFDAEREPYSFHHAKELTLIAFVDSEPILLPFPELDTDKAVSVNHFGSNIVVLFDKNAELAVPFNAIFKGEQLQLTRVSNDGYDLEDHFNLHLYQDQNGNVWNIKGEAIAGPDQGEQLEKISSYIGFWFAATSFFGHAPILHNNDIVVFDISEKLSEYTNESSAPFPLIFFFLALLVVPLFVKKFRR